MANNKSPKETIGSFDQIALSDGRLVETQGSPTEKIDLSKENEAIDKIESFLRKNKNLPRKERENLNRLMSIIGAIKLEKRGDTLKTPLKEEERALWEQFKGKKGESWEILIGTKKEEKQATPEKIEASPNFIDEVNFARLRVALKVIKDALSRSTESMEDEHYFDLLKAEIAFESILDYGKKKKRVAPTSEEIKIWRDFESKKGYIFELTANKKRDEKEQEKKAEPLFSEGQEVKYKNDSGKFEEGWKFVRGEGKGLVSIRKVIEGKIILKTISLEDLKRYQVATEPKDEEKPQPQPQPKIKAPTKPEEAPKKVLEIKKEFSSNIKEKLVALGIKPEDLWSIKDFDKIADSEGKILSVLEKVAQIKLKTIEKDATADYEKQAREEKNFFQKIRTSFSKTENIQKRKYDYEHVPLNLERHREDIETLIYLADVGPDVLVKKDATTGETKLVNEYFPTKTDWLDPEKVEAFNEAATAYSKLPPAYDWHKYPQKKKEFEKVEAEYEKSKNEIFEWKDAKTRFPGVFTEEESLESVEKKINAYKKQVMLDVNDAEFEIKISQTLNHHPDVEMELKKLSETKGWRRDWEAAKAQLLPGSAGFGAGLLTRFSTKSAMASVFGAAAIPVAVVGLGAGFGYYKGWGRAEKSLKKEEELLRMGSENQTMSSRKIDALVAKRAELTDQKEIDAINKKIAEVRMKSTDNHFVQSESLIAKIEDLEKKVSFDYKDYLKEVKGKTLSLEEFNAKKREWAEQLEVRLEFTKDKLDKGEISFGDDTKSLSNKYNLIRKMGDALAVVSMNPSFDEKEMVNQFGHTRRSKLKKITLLAEMHIEKNKHQYVRDQAAIGALTGGLMSGAGYQVGHLVSGAFGSHAAHAVQEEVQTLKVSGNIVAAQHLEKAAEEIPQASLAHDYTQDIVNDIEAAAKEVSKHGTVDGGVHVSINETPLNGPSVEEMNSAVLEEANKISKNNADEYVKKLVDEALGHQKEDVTSSKIKFDLYTKPTDFTDDLPKTSEVTSLPRVEVPIETHVEPAKPFEYVLKNQTQSREYALIKYYESKGLNHHDAGTQAHLRMREIYGPKGERATGFVHKGDHVVITEENGKPQIEVVEEKSIRVLKPTTSAPHIEHPVANNHPITDHLAKDPQKYGFKGDIKNPEEVRAWSNEHTSHLIDKNPHLKHIPPEHIKEVYRTVTGGVHVETHPEHISAALAHYEVKAPTSLPGVLENVLTKDPRWATLSGDEKDRVLYQLFVKEFVGRGHDASFYKGLGIKSGNPFDVKPGTLKLDGLGGKPALDRAFASAHNSSLGVAKGFRNKIGTLIRNTKGYDAEDLFEENIVSILKQK